MTHVSLEKAPVNPQEFWTEVDRKKRQRNLTYLGSLTPIERRASMITGEEAICLIRSSNGNSDNYWVRIYSKNDNGWSENYLISPDFLTVTFKTRAQSHLGILIPAIAKATIPACEKDYNSVLDTLVAKIKSIKNLA